MVLLLVAVVVGVAAGIVRRPSGAHSARPQLNRPLLVGLGTLGTAAAYFFDGSTAVLVHAASLAALLAFAAVNAHLTGMVVIGAGLLLNLVAVVANDGVAVRGSALVEAGLADRSDLATTTFVGPQHLETSDDPLGVLGDALAVPLPVGADVVSFGDLIVVFGAAETARELTRRRRRRWSAEQRSAHRASAERLDSLGAPASIPGSWDGPVIDLRTDPVTPPVPAEDPVAVTAAAAEPIASPEPGVATQPRVPGPTDGGSSEPAPEPAPERPGPLVGTSPA